MYDFEKPLSFHIELTDKCNARCVQCSRNFVDNDGKLKERPELCLTEISLEQYKSIFKNYQNNDKFMEPYITKFNSSSFVDK